MRCASADWAVVTGWQKLLLSLAVVLPIPMLAMSGLTVPLPAAVYRAATAFVESTQGFAGVLTERDAEPAAPAPLLSVPDARRQPVEPSSARLRQAARTSPVRARTSSVAPVPVTAERTSPAAARRPSRSPSAPTPAVAEPAHKGPPSGADAATAPANAGVKTAAPDSSTPAIPTAGPAREQPAPLVEVARVEPPVSPPPAPSPPPPAPPPPALEPVTKTLEPVTKVVEPVTKPVTDVLDPVTAPVLKTGRLLHP